MKVDASQKSGRPSQNPLEGLRDYRNNTPSERRMTHGRRIAALQLALEQAWSIETSTKWLSDDPARGQCSVTALVVQDVLGGDLAKTNVDGAWHFYNLVDGKRQDFSVSQFRKTVSYADLPSNRDEAFSDTSPEQYQVLRERVLVRIEPEVLVS